MIDFPTDLREIELRLIIARAMYERWVQTHTAELIEREFNRMLDVILSSRFRDLTQFQRERAAQLFRELDRVLHQGYATIATDVTRRMEAYAQLEADVSRATVNAVLNVPIAEAATLGVSFYRLPNQYLRSIASLPIQGLKIGDWFEAQAQKMSVETRRVIQQGMIEGKHPTEIARRILAPDKAAAQAGGPPLSKRAKNEARIIARTTVNAVQNDATGQSNAALPPSVSDSYMWVSVRDSRTSKICIALDGRVWKYDDPSARRPPAHPQCRSTTRALIRGAVLPLKDQRVPPTMRSYEGWLKAQPTTVQNDILGPTRAQWFRDGRMSLADLIDQDSRVLTLPQLRTKLGLDGVTHAAAVTPAVTVSF